MKSHNSKSNTSYLFTVFFYFWERIMINGKNIIKKTNTSTYRSVQLIPIHPAAIHKTRKHKSAETTTSIIFKGDFSAICRYDARSNPGNRYWVKDNITMSIIYRAIINIFLARRFNTYY